jgi:dihydroorotase
MPANELTMPLLITGGRVIDPASGFDATADVLIAEGLIAAVGPRIAGETQDHDLRVISADGLVVCPGFIDVHTHLREPGFEYKETIATGATAAARGGFTTLCAMPNTDPPIDNAAMVDFVHRRADAAPVRVHAIGCVTRGRAGHQLADMEELVSAGCVAFSDDGDPVFDAALMRLALTYSRDLGVPISNHCQDHSLCPGGVMAEGWVSSRLGLAGIPAVAEEAMVARDIALAELTGGRLHLAHLSSAGSVSLVREAKARGVKLTAEVCPHHLMLTDAWALGGKGDPSATGSRAYDTTTKVYPPLRTDGDVMACLVGLADGTIDCVATDHAPHERASKECTYNDAAFGISVLETALGTLLEPVHAGAIDLPTMVERLTVGPTRVLGGAFAPFATLAAGSPADVVLFDPDAAWTVDVNKFASLGRNTPLDGVELRGRVAATVVGGRVVFEEPTLISAGGEQ